MSDTVKFFNIVSENDEYYELVACQPYECDSAFITSEEYKSLCVQNDYENGIYVKKPYDMSTLTGESNITKRCLKTSYIDKMVAKMVKAFNDRPDDRKTVNFYCPYELEETKAVIDRELKKHNIRFTGTRLQKYVAPKPKLDKRSIKRAIVESFATYMKKQGISILYIDNKEKEEAAVNVIRFFIKENVTFDEMVMLAGNPAKTNRDQKYIKQLWALGEHEKTQ